jgi:3',5'-cyclic AMP phosphodiesterase CpdA
VRSAVPVPARSETVTIDGVTAQFHSVKFMGLTPNTKYVYRVGDNVQWSEWFQFTTASDTDAPFSFIYFGDAQNEIRSMWSRVIRQAVRDLPDASFFLHAGDLIDHPNADEEWGEWFGGAGWANAMIPSVPSPGNHEYGGTPRVISSLWRPQFALPTNGVPGLEESNYFFDYQGARIISLNSNEKVDEQAVWLDRLLAQGRPRWVIVTFHHPVFSAAQNRDNPRIRNAWKPIFDKHRVDLVLQGHDHTYARGTYSNVPEGTRGRAGSTMYVVSVSGPKMYNLDREPWMQRAAEDTQLYQLITVDRNSIRYEARTASGRPYDGFALVKQRDGSNRLQERIPRTPENRRLTPVASDR